MKKVNSEVFKEKKENKKFSNYSEELFFKYEQNLLTNSQLDENLYPRKSLPLYSSYLEFSEINIKEKFIDNIIAIDCEMVLNF